MSFPAHLPIPQGVLQISERLEAEGFETWCVGGAVRDNLLEVASKDFDLATAATPEQVRRLFPRTIPIGIDHGTVAVLDPDRQPHEVTTFRKDVKTDGRHAVVEFGVSLDEDLARRDFTINAIAYHPATKQWRDLFEGEADLAARTIRAVGDPAQRFREDYLRILRALRLSARFGFQIDPATWEAARAQVAGIEHLSAERVRDEWMRGLEKAVGPSLLVDLWRDVGALGIWLPELGERWEEEPACREVIDAVAPQDPILITSYLSREPARVLEVLRCSNNDIARAGRIAEFRDQVPDPSSGTAVRQWMAAAGPAVDDLVTLAKAEQRGARLAEAVNVFRASKVPLITADLAVDGKDLMALGMKAGPELGRLLAALLERTIEDPSLNTKAELLRLAREALKET